MNERAQFADNLRRLRRQAGMSQEELADACGVHRTEVSLLERGGRDPRLTTLVRLARGLNLPTVALLERVERD